MLLYLVSLLAALIALFLAVLVYLKNPRSRINKSFAILAGVMCIWILTNLGGVTGKEIFARSTYAIGSLLGCGILLFFMDFTGKKISNLTRSIHWGLGFFFFALGFTKYFVTNVRNVTLGAFEGEYEIGFYFWCLFLSVYLLYSVFLGIQYYVKSDSLKRRQQKYIILGFAVTIGFTILVDVVAPIMGEKQLMALDSSGSLFLLAFTAYAIIRYRAMEIDTVIHKTALWVLTLLLVILPISLPAAFYIDWIISLSQAGKIALISAVLIFFVWYYSKLKPKVDHLFRRRKYDYYEVLNGLGQKIGSELELDKVQQRLFKELKEILYIRNGILLAQQPGQEDYEEVGSLSGEEITDPSKPLLSLLFHSKLSQYLSREQKALEREQIEVDPQYQEIKEEALAWLKQKEIEVLIPIVLEGNVNGLIGIGKKENLQAYTQKDIELLEKMGKQIGITIDNALHHEDIVEKGRMEEEMKLGQEIQLNLLPKEAPQVEGLKVTGLMIPAKEIGGDYYDYITTVDSSPLPFRPAKRYAGAGQSLVSSKEEGQTITDQRPATSDQKLAIVIGDVSGKGVAAGLIMATAKATLKGLSDQGLSPRQMLSKANSLLLEYTKGEKFMTMLYLTWDNQQKKLNYSSAGHEHILIYRCKGVEAQPGNSASCKDVEKQDLKGTDSTAVQLYSATSAFVEVIQSGGIMLGMLPDINGMLEDRSLQLNPGDKVVLYTDGVTEAHNPAGELYTLKRLAGVVNHHGHKPSDQLLATIKEEVYGFISTQDQYDDITLLVMEVEK